MRVIVESLLPVFLLIGLGSLLQRGSFFADGVLAGVNRLIYWVALPAVIFVGLATADTSAANLGGLSGAFAVATVFVIVVAWAVGRLMRLPVGSRGTFGQAAFRGNLAFVALPVVLAVPGASHAGAALLLGPAMVLYNLVSVSWLLASRGRSERGYAKSLLIEIARNPMLLACIAGGLVLLAGIELPRVLLSTLRLMGGMVVPMALVSVGAVLVSLSLRGSAGPAVGAALLKVALAPLAGWFVGGAFGLAGPEMTTLLIFLAAPTAVISHTMVKQLGGDEPLAASAVVVSTLLSALALAGVLLWSAR